MKIFRSHWFWFYLAILLISIVDFIDPITRPNTSYFRDNQFHWLLFSFASLVTLYLVIYFANRLSIKIFKKENLFLQSGAIISGLLCHISVNGPILDRLIFGQSTLTFYPNPIQFIAGLSIFYLISGIMYMTTKKAREIH